LFTAKRTASGTYSS